MLPAFVFIFSAIFGVALANDVTCLQVGQNATATWRNALNQTCSYQTEVGSNFGKDPLTGGSYNCNGRCGSSCKGISIGNVYTQQCLNHDICSYFNNATAGPNDPNCGAAFLDATPGFVAGAALGCGQANIVLAPIKPTTGPVCV